MERILSKNTFYIHTVNEIIDSMGNECIVDYEFTVLADKSMAHVLYLRPIGLPKEDGFIEWSNVQFNSPNITNLILKTLPDEALGFNFDNYKFIHLKNTQ